VRRLFLIQEFRRDFSSEPFETDEQLENSISHAHARGLNGDHYECLVHCRTLHAFFGFLSSRLEDVARVRKFGGLAIC
jgi:hypothetical protein